MIRAMKRFPVRTTSTFFIPSLINSTTSTHQAPSFKVYTLTNKLSYGQLSYVRVIMSQNNSRNLATPRSFDSWLSAFPSRPGNYYTQHRESSSSAQMEIWTPYDGISSTPQTDLPVQGNRQHRDPGRFDRPWRNTGGFDSNQMHNGRQSHHRQRERPRSAARSPPAKRSKVPKSGFQRQGSGFQRQDSDFQRQDWQEWSERENDVQATEKPSLYGSSELFNADYLSEHYPPIDREIYKSAPITLWENPKIFLSETAGVHMSSSFIVARVGNYRCNLVLNLNTDRRRKMDAIGDGMSKVSHAACRAVL